MNCRKDRHEDKAIDDDSLTTVFQLVIINSRWSVEDKCPHSLILCPSL